jgi:hypothetical protein
MALAISSDRAIGVVVALGQWNFVTNRPAQLKMNVVL